MAAPFSASDLVQCGKGFFYDPGKTVLYGAALLSFGIRIIPALQNYGIRRNSLMMFKGKIIVALGLFITLFSAVPIYSQEDALPDWVRLEQAKRLFEEGLFGEALVVFKDLRESTDSYPEADFWIGRIYEEEGELSLAEAQYLKALDKKKDLYMNDDVLLILGRLAYIYRISRQYHKYEEILKESLSFSPVWNAPEAPRRYPLMVRTLKEKGLDKLFELHRIDNSKAFHVHSELGLYYYRTGRYEESIRHLLTSLLAGLTAIITEVRYTEPLYEAEGVEDLLRKGQTSERIQSYLETVSFYPVAYYLGAALYALGEIRESRALFSLVANYAPSDRWSAEAMRQLTDPFIEPVLTSEEYFYF